MDVKSHRQQRKLRPRLEPNQEAREAMQRLARMYLENVPEAYLHMAIAMRNLLHFTQDDLRGELERRDARSAFPDTSELLEALDLLEIQALEDAAAALGLDDVEPSSEVDSDDSNELPAVPPLSELEPLDEPPPTPRVAEPEELDDRAVLVDDEPNHHETE